jgi:hypothetical protein
LAPSGQLLAASVGVEQAGRVGKDVLGGVELRRAAVDVGVIPGRDSDSGGVVGVDRGGHGAIGGQPHKLFGGLEGEEQLSQVVDVGLLGQRSLAALAGQSAGDGVGGGEQVGQDGGHRGAVRVRAMPQRPRLVNSRGERSNRRLLVRRDANSVDHGCGYGACCVVCGFAERGEGDGLLRSRQPIDRSTIPPRSPHRGFGRVLMRTTPSPTLGAVRPHRRPFRFTGW